MTGSLKQQNVRRQSLLRPSPKFAQGSPPQYETLNSELVLGTRVRGQLILPIRSGRTDAEDAKIPIYVIYRVTSPLSDEKAPVHAVESFHSPNRTRIRSRIQSIKTQRFLLQLSYSKTTQDVNVVERRFEEVIRIQKRKSPGSVSARFFELHCCETREALI